MTPPRHPLLYQINTRVVLAERAAALGYPATLDDLSDREIDRIADLGFDWVWLLGVWQTGPAGREVARNEPALRREYDRYDKAYRAVWRSWFRSQRDTVRS